MSEERGVPARAIVIVGEHAAVRQHLRNALRAADYGALEAVNLEHAGQILRQLNDAPTLILACTRSEPEADRIKAWHAQHSQVPLLIMPVDDDSIGNLDTPDILLRVEIAVNRPVVRTSVLVVCESDSEREMLASMLETAGYIVAQSSDGQQALDLIEANAPDILLTDVVMSVKEGLELIQEVRERYPRTMMFAMCGGPRGSNYLKIAKRFGVTGTLDKPVSVRELLKRLREAAEPRQTAD